MSLYAALVLIALPGAIAYPITYAASSRWWTSAIGRALLIKATGVALLLVVTGLYQVFGPDYWGREVIRSAGLALVTVGIYAALYALIRTLHERRRARD